MPRALPMWVRVPPSALKGNMKAVNVQFGRYEPYWCGKNRYGMNQYLFEFDNDYGASVLMHPENNSLFELGIIKFKDDGTYRLHTSNGITDDKTDVIVNITNEQVVKLLFRVSKLR